MSSSFKGRKSDGSLVECFPCNVIFRFMSPLIIYSMYLMYCLVLTSLHPIKITSEEALYCIVLYFRLFQNMGDKTHPFTVYDAFMQS